MMSIMWDTLPTVVVVLFSIAFVLGLGCAIWAQHEARKAREAEADAKARAKRSDVALVRALAEVAHLRELYCDAAPMDVEIRDDREPVSSPAVTGGA